MCADGYGENDDGVCILLLIPVIVSSTGSSGKLSTGVLAVIIIFAIFLLSSSSSGGLGISVKKGIIAKKHVPFAHKIFSCKKFGEDGHHCEECADGYYYLLGLLDCKKCTTCGDDQFVGHECSHKHDTVCKLKIEHCEKYGDDQLEKSGVSTCDKCEDGYTEEHNICHPTVENCQN